jgi:hypothetical protein
MQSDLGSLEASVAPSLQSQSAAVQTLGEAENLSRAATGD